MFKNCSCSHVRLRLVFALGLALAPLPAFGVTITGAGVDEATSAQLGSGLINGSECLQTAPDSTSCSDSKTNSGPVTLTVPTFSGIDSTISTTAGSNSVGASGDARVQLFLPQAPDLTVFPGAVVLGQLQASTSLRDSDSTSFHTSASASASSDDFLQFVVPSLPLDERFLMNVGLTSSMADFTTLFTGNFKVEDVTAGSVLANFDESNPGSTVLDLTGLAGHDVRVSMLADMAMSGADGFGGGVDPLGQRSFFTFLSGNFVLREVPEPGTAALLVVGLSALAVACRRRA